MPYTETRIYTPTDTNTHKQMARPQHHTPNTTDYQQQLTKLRLATETASDGKHMLIPLSFLLEYQYSLHI